MPCLQSLNEFRRLNLNRSILSQQCSHISSVRHLVSLLHMIMISITSYHRQHPSFVLTPHYIFTNAVAFTSTQYNIAHTAVLHGHKFLQPYIIQCINCIKITDTHWLEEALKQGNLKGESVKAAILLSFMWTSCCISGFFDS